MKSKIKQVYRLALAVALLTFVTLNGIAAPSSATKTNYPPIRISLRYGYYGGYYRPIFPSYYPWGYPRLGFFINVLPFGYIPFYYGSLPYYYYDGVYYRPYENGYQVTVPPVGAEIPQLPAHTRPILINNQQYYVLNGVYYKPYTNPDNTQGYIIAGKDGVLNTSITAPMAPAAPAPTSQPMAQPAPSGPPVNAPAPVVGPPSAMPPVVADMPKIGDTVTQLPDGCKSVNIAGKTYFVSPAEVYYEQAIDGNNVIYKVQGVPSANQKQ